MGTSGAVELTCIADDTSRITALAQDLPCLAVSGGALARSQSRVANRRAATGARVTLEFFVSAPFPKDRGVRLLYDFADNGTWRACSGVPQLTHIKPDTVPATYHYRMSHWIAAEDIKRFVLR